MVFNFLGPSTEDAFSWLIAASLTSFHTSIDCPGCSQAIQPPESPSRRGTYMSWIVERFLNAEMHCFNAGRLLLPQRSRCFFLHPVFLSAIQKRRDAEFKLTCTTDNSRIPGQASAIPVSIYVRSPYCRRDEMDPTLPNISISRI